MRCDPCLDHAEMLAHPQFEALDMVVTYDHPKRGKIRMLGAPAKFKGTPLEYKLPPPLLGQHTEEILREINYTDKEIDDLIEKGVVRTTTRWVRHEEIEEALIAKGTHSARRMAREKEQQERKASTEADWRLKKNEHGQERG